jgi:hypothetical protein
MHVAPNMNPLTPEIVFGIANSQLNEREKLINKEKYHDS